MDDRSISISITTGTIIKTMLVLVAAWFLFVLRDVALVVLTAIVIASAVDPGVRGLMRQGFPRVLAVISVYACLFGLFFVIFYFFLPSLLEDLATFISSVPIYLNAFSQSGAFDHYAQFLGFPSP